MALIAGLLTFRAINEATTNAALSQLEDIPTIQVLVAVQNISAYQLIDESMVQIQKVPAPLAPEGYLKSVDEVLYTFSNTPVVAGEILLQHRLINPTDPTSPVLYRINANEVLVAVPASALLGQVGMLAVGNHVDSAYTVAIDFNPEADQQPEESPVTTFLSLQNLEVKGLLRRQPPMEEGNALLRPDAVLLAVSPQDALVLKHLVDTGAPMDFFLRAPRNQALSPVLPVDAQYLIDRFQLHIETPSQLVSDGALQASPVTADEANPTTSSIQQNVLNDPTEETSSGE
jgi:pilus assembly protein CpaB